MKTTYSFDLNHTSQGSRHTRCTNPVYQELVNCGLQAKSSLSPIFIKYHWDTAMTIHLHIIYGHLYTSVAEFKIIWLLTHCWVAFMVKNISLSDWKWSAKPNTWHKLVSRSTMMWLVSNLACRDENIYSWVFYKKRLVTTNIKHLSLP